jgi:hypothetical protein
MIKNPQYYQLYKEAIYRLLTDKPMRMPIGTRITQRNVTLEVGFSKGVVSSIHRNYPEILILIEDAQKEQIISDNAYTRKNLAVFYAALDRLIKNTPFIVPKYSKINTTNVALEAGKAKNTIRHDRINYTPLIKAIADVPKAENRTIQLREQQLEQALSRLVNGKPLRVNPNCKITSQSVSQEAGLNSSYICSNRNNLGHFIVKLKELKQVNIS